MIASTRSSVELKILEYLEEGEDLFQALVEGKVSLVKLLGLK